MIELKNIKNLGAKLLWISFSSLALVLALGCSQQYRTADPGITDGELMSRLEQLTENSAFSGSPELNQFNALVYDDSLSTIYYSEGPGPLGLPESVMSLTDLSFISGLPTGVTPFDLDNVFVAFVYGYLNDETPAAAMLVEATLAGQTYTEVLSSTGEPSFSDKDFGVELVGPGGTLVLRSYDVSEVFENELESVIQLKAYTYDGAGNEVYIGKFSTLVGFGGIN